MQEKPPLQERVNELKLLSDQYIKCWARMEQTIFFFGGVLSILWGIVMYTAETAVPFTFIPFVVGAFGIGYAPKLDAIKRFLETQKVGINRIGAVVSMAVGVFVPA